MGIIIRYIILFINLPFIGRLILKPLIFSVVKLCSRRPIIKEKLINGSNRTLRNT